MNSASHKVKRWFLRWVVLFAIMAFLAGFSLVEHALFDFQHVIPRGRWIKEDYGHYLYFLHLPLTVVVLSGLVFMAFSRLKLDSQIISTGLIHDHAKAYALFRYMLIAMVGVTALVIITSVAYALMDETIHISIQLIGFFLAELLPITAFVLTTIAMLVIGRPFLGILIMAILIWEGHDRLIGNVYVGFHGAISYYFDFELISKTLLDLTTEVNYDRGWWLRDDDLALNRTQYALGIIRKLGLICLCCYASFIALKRWQVFEERIQRLELEDMISEKDMESIEG